MVGSITSEAGTLVLLAQKRAQPPSNELVEPLEGEGMGMFEVGKPAFQHRVEVLDDARETLPARSSRPRPDVVLEAVQALLADPTPSGFEPVAEELEPLPGLPVVADMRLVRMQTQAVVQDPGSDCCQGGISLLVALAQDHKVVRITHHPIAVGRHQFIERVQVAVGQQRADHRTLRRAFCRRSVLSIPHPPSYPPSLGTVLLPALFAALTAAV